MDNELLQKLKDWRQKIATSEGIPSFRIFSNRTLEDIAYLKPSNKNEFIEIKGIKDKKFDKYGTALLNMINENTNFIDIKKEDMEEKPFSISEYLNFLNGKLISCQAKIRGEISSLDVRDNVLYFSLKDSIDGSAINCLMWKNAYALCGIEFEIGMDIILGGYPDIYKPSGRLSFKTSVAELVGEGALKKQYEQLKVKLQKEGLLDISRKRPIPIFPHKIGLITSKTGAAIGDFQMNLGRYGFKVALIDSRVEGQSAVKELLNAIRSFKNRDIDTLVLIRGGGSFESLLPFNNEVLAREVAKFPVPVLVGVGHERDVSLVGLVADKTVSTPTAAAQTLNESWRQAIAKVQLNQQKIFSKYANVLSKNNANIHNCFQAIKEYFAAIFKNFNNTEQAFSRGIMLFEARISELKKSVNAFPSVARRGMKSIFDQVKKILISLEKIIEISNPERQLKLGYGIVRIDKSVVRSVENIKKGETVEIQLQDGFFKSDVSAIRNNLKIDE